MPTLFRDIFEAGYNHASLHCFPIGMIEKHAKDNPRAGERQRLPERREAELRHHGDRHAMRQHAADRHGDERLKIAALLERFPIGWTHPIDKTLLQKQETGASTPLIGL